MNFQFKDNNMHCHWSVFKSYSLFTTIWYLGKVMSPMYSAGSCSVAKGPFTKYMTLFLPIFYPSLPPCDNVWQLAVQLIIKYVTLSQPPPPKKNQQILAKQKFNMQQQIQNVLYKSTLFQCLIKPRPKLFPTQVLAGSLNNNIFW
jgi:hypothetical protein